MKSADPLVPALRQWRREIGDRSPHYPALALWHNELRAGLRTRTTFDVLHDAACAESHAREHYGMRIPVLGDHYMARSLKIIRQAGSDFAKRSA